MTTPAPDSSRAADETMRDDLASELADVLLEGGALSPKMFADRLMARPLAPFLLKAAHLRAENARLLERIREAEKGTEAMQTELRPFADGEGEGLDEVVIYGSHIVHAETMSDTALWIGIHDQAGGLVHIWVNAVRRKGRLGIVMTATDEGERGTIGQGAAKPLAPETQEAGDAE